MGERKKKKLKREAGLFHDFPEVVQVAIIQSAIDDAAEQRKCNYDELEAQRKAKESKEKLLHELNLLTTRRRLTSMPFTITKCIILALA